MLAMLLLADGDEPVDLALRLIGRFQVRQILFRTIPTVGQNRFRTLPRLLLDGFHHRLQLLFVIAGQHAQAVGFQRRKWRRAGEEPYLLGDEIANRGKAL
jgi:hypothetical protein